MDPDDVNRLIVQLARIATALEKLHPLVQAMDRDGEFRPAFRITGELIGGEGDVREPA